MIHPDKRHDSRDARRVHCGKWPSIYWLQVQGWLEGIIWMASLCQIFVNGESQLMRFRQQTGQSSSITNHHHPSLITTIIIHQNPSKSIIIIIHHHSGSSFSIINVIIIHNYHHWNHPWQQHHRHQHHRFSDLLW